MTHQSSKKASQADTISPGESYHKVRNLPITTFWRLYMINLMVNLETMEETIETIVHGAKYVQN